jgi:hypothetical protein
MPIASQKFFAMRTEKTKWNWSPGELEITGD